MTGIEINNSGVRELIRLAFTEDAPFGDMSAQYSVPANHQSDAVVIAREALVFCGEKFVPLLFDEFKGSLKFSIAVNDGARLNDQQILVNISGKTRNILQIERPLLNFLQRLCGVSTYTAEIVAQASGVSILDTRKTMPGWRALDKYAVKCGGGINHRFSLSDMIVIKNNHIDAHGGSVADTLRDLVASKPRYMPFQVEVRSLDELKSVIPFKPTAVMLDNMNDQLIEECLVLLKKEAPAVLVEASGGITAERLSRLAAIGVPAVSMGALTTCARNRDISLRIKKTGSAQS